MPVRSLSKELQEIATRELNEIPEETQAHIDDLKKWLAAQPDIKTKSDDQWLLGFLRGCKFNLQKAKQKLENYSVMKTKAPELYSNRDPLLPEIQDILNRGIFLPLKNTTDPAAPTPLIFRWSRADPKTNLFVDLTKVGLMIMDILINEDDSFVVAGQQFLADYEGFSARYLTQFTPGICYKSAQMIQNVYPMRIKGAFFVNVPSVFKIIYNLFKMFLSKKIMSRIKVYQNDGTQEEDLLNQLSLDALPKEYGGNGDSVDEIIEEWKKKVESYREWFLQD